jgi:hypothetical protein
VAVPPEVADGSYRFRLDVVDVGNPDEFAAEGPWTQLFVPPHPEVKRRVPWLWIGIAAAVVVLLVAGAVTAFVLTHPAKGSLQATAKPDFGVVKLNTQATAAVTVRNTGSGDTGLTPRLSGDTTFKVGKNGCAAKLHSGASCEVDVVFAPVAVGPQQATLQLHADNAADPPPIAFKGSGGQGALTFAPNPGVLTVHVGLFSPTLTADPLQVTVTNSGSAPVTIRAARVQQATPYTRLVSTTCAAGQSLAPGQSCAVVLVFDTTKVALNANNPPFDPNTALLLDTDLPASPSSDHIGAVFSQG